jgi:hypothetical protein
MRLVLLILLFVGETGFAFAGEPFDIRAGIDVRAVYSNAQYSSLDGGYGHTRFDDDHQGLRLGSAYISTRYRLADTVALYGDALGYADGNSSMLDVTQLYIHWRPFPISSIRISSKIGMFYPEFSMENRGAAWTPVYTITPSAINSWYGEELRTLGTELTARWLGSSHGYQGDVAFIAGTYEWNDPIGVAVASHGWNLHDRQTGLTGYLVTTGNRAQHIHEFREIDGRVGFYAGLQWRHGDHLDVRVYRYDNRADPAAFKDVFAWLTRFDTVGIRWEVDEDWTVLAQWLQGDTFIGPPQQWGAVWDMQSKYLLVSRQWHDWRFSLRRDQFSTYQYRGAGNTRAYDDDGSAWTVAVMKELGPQFQIAAEWLRVDSTFRARNYAALAPRQLESQAQLSLRYKWHH